MLRVAAAESAASDAAKSTAGLRAEKSEKNRLALIDSRAATELDEFTGDGDGDDDGVAEDPPKNLLCTSGVLRHA